MVQQDTEQTDSAAADQTPGQQFKAAREAAGFSVESVAQQLRLTENYIHYLEGDNYAKLPAKPFVLGYFKAYARILNVPAQTFIDGYYAYHQAETPADEPVVNSAAEALKSAPAAIANIDNGRLYAIAVAILVAVWLLVSLFADKPSESAVLQSNDVAPAQAEIDPPVNEVAETPTADDAISHVDVSPEGDAQELSASADGNDASVVLAQAQPVVEPKSLDTEPKPLMLEAERVEPTPASNGLDRLELAFTAECWLEVTDANGDVVAANLYQNGDTARLAGVAPFEVMFGNVRAAASVRLNGSLVEITPRGFRKTLRTIVGAPSE